MMQRRYWHILCVTSDLYIYIYTATNQKEQTTWTLINEPKLFGLPDCDPTLFLFNAVFCSKCPDFFYLWRLFLKKLTMSKIKKSRTNLKKKTWQWKNRVTLNNNIVIDIFVQKSSNFRYIKKKFHKLVTMEDLGNLLRRTFIVWLSI